MIQFKGDEWEGLEGTADELLAELRPEVEKLVKDGLVMAESTVKQTLTGARSGRTYKVSKAGRLHVASAPGEPPAVLFGNLRASVGHTDVRWVNDGAEGDFGPGLGKSADKNQAAESYARRMEYGGVDSRGVKIDARPYMQPSADKLEPQLERLFERL